MTPDEVQSLWAEDFESPQHDLRCSYWMEPVGPCTCRDLAGYTKPVTLAARLDLVLPVELACDDDTDIEAAS